MSVLEFWIPVVRGIRIYSQVRISKPTIPDITQLKFLDSGTQITLRAWRRRAESDLGLNAFLLSLTDGYGFNVKGGRDKPYQEGDPCVYITRLRPGAAAEKNGLLSPGDRIVEVCDLGNFLYKKIH